MSIRQIVLMLLVLGGTATLAQKPEPKPTPLSLPFKLNGDGHTCAGYLRVTPQEFVWKGSFSLCRSTSWQSFQEGKSWIFVLHGPQINKEKCGMPIVKIELEKYMSEVWEVAGYGSLEEMRKAPTRPLLDCELM